MNYQQYIFRHELVKIMHHLSKDDRQQLANLLVKDVPKYLWDDPTPLGTFYLIEFLFNKAIITDQNYSYLIELIKKIGCHDVARKLLEHQQVNEKRDLFTISKTYPETINPTSLPFFSANLKNVDIERETLINNTKKSSCRYSCLASVFKKSWNIRDMILIAFILSLFTFTFIMIRREYPCPCTNIMKIERAPLRSAFISADTVWSQQGTIVGGGNYAGDSMNQIYYPYGLFVDNNQTIYIADNQNHRIIAWDYGATKGRVVAGGNGAGDRLDQLKSPTDVIVDEKSNSIIICDYDNQRVVQWDLHKGTIGRILLSNGGYIGLTMDDRGFVYVTDQVRNNIQRWQIGDAQTTVVAGVNGKGDRLDQFNEPRYIYIDQNYSIYVSDWKNHRVMKWISGAKEGTIVAGGQGEGNSSRQLSYPEGVVVDQSGTVYVVDQWNHRVMQWRKGETHGNVVVGGNDTDNELKRLHRPVGLSFDRYGNLYVVEHGNHRVQRYNID